MVQHHFAAKHVKKGGNNLVQRGRTKTFPLEGRGTSGRLVRRLPLELLVGRAERCGAANLRKVVKIFEHDLK
jgi:hypothetical protein